MVETLAGKMKLIGALLGVVLAGTLVGSAIDWARLPGVDLDASPVLAELRADRASPAAGPRDASVTIMVFTDYQCGVCRIDHRGLREMATERPDLRFVYKEWAILGLASRRAARVALAAAYQGRYAAARDVLMRVNVADADAMAQGLAGAGVELNRLARDLEKYGADIDRELARTSRQAFALGLAGTPAYLVGRRLVIGRLGESKLRRLIARAEAGAATR